MQNIIYGVTILLIIGLFVNFKKTFFIIMAVQPFLTLPLTFTHRALYTIIMSIAVLMFLVFKKPYYANEKYPFWNCTIIMAISILLTTFFNSQLGYVSNIITSWIMPFVFWCLLKTEKDVKFFCRMATIFIIIVVAYGLFEEITKSNPVHDYMDRYFEIYFSHVGHIGDERYGITIISSILVSRDFLGFFGVLWFLTIVYLRNTNSPYFRSNSMPILLVGLILIIFFSGARSAYLALFVGCIGLMSKNTLKSKWLPIIMMILILSISLVLPYLDEIINSFVHTDSLENGGSNTEMRLIQLSTSYELMMRSPIFGNGIGFMTDITQAIDDLWGGESIWFATMIDRGFVGIISQFFVFLYPIVYMWKRKIIEGIFVVLAYITLQSATSCPEYMYMVWVVLFVRIRTINNYCNKQVINYAE